MKQSWISECGRTMHASVQCANRGSTTAPVAHALFSRKPWHGRQRRPSTEMADLRGEVNFPLPL